MGVITVTEYHGVNVAIPETGQHVHAFSGDDFGVGGHLQRTNGPDSGDALIFDNDYAVRQWVAAEAVDETTTDERKRARLYRYNYGEEKR
jgi:hypothetical protein